MGINSKEIIKHVLRSLDDFDFIRPEDVPNIDLYMDQVTTFMEQHLAGTRRYPEDKILTKTMINNYAKNNLLPPPEKKKYSRDHILLLVFIYYFKNIICISDIDKLMAPITGNSFKNQKKNLDDVYEMIFELEHDQAQKLSKDIIKKFNIAQESFPDASGNEAEYLRTFALICMLSFDVYLKKVLIERLIDELPDLKKDSKVKKKKDR